MKKYLLILIVAIFCLPNVSSAQQYGTPGYYGEQIHPRQSALAEIWAAGKYGGALTSYDWGRPNLRKNHKKDGKISLDPVEYIKPIEEVVDGTTGTATLRWSDGSSYVGETYRTTLHGTGTMTYSDKGKYHGQWKYSHRDGIGTMVYPDGSKYCGTWERDLPNGNGTFQTPEGITFTVNFENGIPHGKGVIQDLDGRKYTARWVRGKLKAKSIKPLEEKK